MAYGADHLAVGITDAKLPGDSRRHGERSGGGNARIRSIVGKRSIGGNSQRQGIAGDQTFNCLERDQTLLVCALNECPVGLSDVLLRDPG